MSDIDQIIRFLRAWSDDQTVIAKSNHPSREQWFLARAQALADAACEIEAGSFKDGVRGFLKLRAPGASADEPS